VSCLLTSSFGENYRGFDADLLRGLTRYCFLCAAACDLVGASSPLAMGSTGFSWMLPDHPKLPKGKPVAVVMLDGWREANPTSTTASMLLRLPSWTCSRMYAHFSLYLSICFILDCTVSFCTSVIAKVHTFVCTLYYISCL